MKSDVKPSTWTFYQPTRKRLGERFGNRKLQTITPLEARAFRNWLESQSNKRDKAGEDGIAKPLASNTVRRRIGLCKQIFGQVLEDGLIQRNPFKGMASVVRSNKERKECIPVESFFRVLRSRSQRSMAGNHGSGSGKAMAKALAQSSSIRSYRLRKIPTFSGSG